MLIYTLIASLPLLVAILTLDQQIASLSLALLTGFNTSSVSFLFLTILILAFLAKLPLYLLHLWLPKAHVEAPVTGSIVLAGVLLKLGGYGLIRVIPLLEQPSSQYSWVWVRWSLIGGAILSLFCLRQTDIKILIALSSVRHIALVIRRIFTLSTWGINGAIIIMIGHGFCSSALFFAANRIYQRLSTRRLFLLKGMLRLAPPIALWWFLLSTSNMAVPPSLNLLGEINRIIALSAWCSYLIIPLI